MIYFEKHKKLYYYKELIKNPKKLIDLIEDSEKSNCAYISKWFWVENIEDIEIFKIAPHYFTQEKNIQPDLKFKSLNSITINKVIFDSIEKIKETYIKNKYILKHISIYKNRMGSTMGEHIDSNRGEPITSILLFLNEDYEGGEINFPKMGLKFKPSPGSALVFPSDPEYSHFSSIITKGSKYTVNSFWG